MARVGLERVLRRGVSAWAHAAAGLAISGIFGWLAIRDVSWGSVRVSLEQIRPGWLIAALLLLAVAVGMRSERWRLLFARDRRPPRRAVFWSLGIGYLFNNLLPARAGEAARVVALRREAGVSAARGAATVAVERVFDLASLAIVMLVAAPALGSGSVVRVTVWTSAAVLAAAAGLAGGCRSDRLRRRIAAAVVRIPLIRGPRARSTAAELGQGLRGLSDARMAIAVGAWSLGSWLVLACSYYTVLRSLGIPSPARAAVLSLVVTNLVQVIPASAASLGVFEAAGRAAVAAYGAGPAAASNTPRDAADAGITCTRFVTHTSESTARAGGRGDLQAAQDTCSRSRPGRATSPATTRRGPCAIRASLRPLSPCPSSAAVEPGARPSDQRDASQLSRDPAAQAVAAAIPRQGQPPPRAWQRARPRSGARVRAEAARRSCNEAWRRRARPAGLRV